MIKVREATSVASLSFGERWRAGSGGLRRSGASVKGAIGTLRNHFVISLSPRPPSSSRFLKQLHNAEGHKKATEKLREYISWSVLENDKPEDCTEDSKKGNGEGLT